MNKLCFSEWKLKMNTYISWTPLVFFIDNMPCMYLVVDGWVIKAPDNLFTRSQLLNKEWATKNNLVVIDNLCTLGDLKEILDDICEAKIIRRCHYVTFIKLCHKLKVEDDFIKRLLPLEEINFDNLSDFNHALYIMTRTKYIGLLKHIFIQKMGYTI